MRTILHDYSALIAGHQPPQYTEVLCTDHAEDFWQQKTGEYAGFLLYSIVVVIMDEATKDEATENVTTTYRIIARHAFARNLCPGGM